METLGDLGSVWQAIIATAVAIPSLLMFLRGRRKESPTPPPAPSVEASSQPVEPEAPSAAEQLESKGSRSLVPKDWRAIGSWLTESRPRLDLLALLDAPNDSDALESWLAERWRRSETRPIVYLLGLDHRERRVLVDWARHGPNGLVAGPSGSGTSETLRSMVTYLCLSYPPSRLRIHLVDFRGGGAVWSPVESFPQVAVVRSTSWSARETDSNFARDLVESLHLRLVEKLAVIEGSDSDSLAEHNEKADAADQLPIDIVFIDDQIHSDGFDFRLDQTLEDLARRGASLGMGFVSTTQITDPDYRPPTMFRFVVAQGGAAHGFAPDRDLPSDIVPGRGILVKSGTFAGVLQVATVGSLQRESRDSPSLRNVTVEGLAATAHAVNARNESV